MDKIFVYGIKQEGGLWHVGTHSVHGGNVAGALAGYRAYECNRMHVEKALAEGVPAGAAWDGNRYVFSPTELDLATGAAV